MDDTGHRDADRLADLAHRSAAIRGGVVGNLVDMVHIFLPLVALAPATKTLAGPQAGASSAALVVATLLARPIGAVIFGTIADRVGRTRVTRFAIAGTALCALGVALAPTYEAVGAFAWWWVVALRFLAGVFLAGEYTSAIPLAMEWSAPRHRGLVSGLIMAMAPWAQALIALSTLGGLALLGPGAYASWGWRVLFAAGALASGGMWLWYRRFVADAPAFVRQVPDERRPTPRDLLLGRWARRFWPMLGLMSGLWLMTNVVVIALTGRLVARDGVSPESVSAVMAVASIGQAIGMSFTGHLSTLLGRRRYLVLAGIVASVLGPVLWAWTLGRSSLVLVALGAAALQVVTVTAYGPMGAYLSEGLPTAIRATGYGAAYSWSIVVPALLPMWGPPLQEAVGDTVSVPVVLLGLAGLLVAACAALGPALTRRDLDSDIESIARDGVRGGREVGARA